MVYVTVYTPKKPALDPSVAVMFFVAVTTVLLAAYIANTPFEFLRYVHHKNTTMQIITCPAHELKMVGKYMYSMAPLLSVPDS